MRRSPADSTNRSLAAFGKLQHIRIYTLYRAVGVQRLVSLRFLVRTRMAAPRLERPYQPSR